jgi:hypothetical protein
MNSDTFARSQGEVERVPVVAVLAVMIWDHIIKSARRLKEGRGLRPRHV